LRKIFNVIGLVINRKKMLMRTFWLLVMVHTR
jgi:hypothetical protein